MSAGGPTTSGTHPQGPCEDSPNVVPGVLGYMLVCHRNEGHAEQAVGFGKAWQIEAQSVDALVPVPLNRDPIAPYTKPQQCTPCILFTLLQVLEGQRVETRSRHDGLHRAMLAKA